MSEIAFSTVGQPRRITGREQRQSRRYWAELHRMADATGHADCQWQGSGQAPFGHRTLFVYWCADHNELMFTVERCERRICRVCYPESLIERLWARLRRA